MDYIKIRTNKVSKAYKTPVNSSDKDKVTTDFTTVHEMVGKRSKCQMADLIKIIAASVADVLLQQSNIIVRLVFERSVDVQSIEFC